MEEPCFITLIVKNGKMIRFFQAVDTATTMA
jgi:hypothetical protein